jgi:hypothetical protein
VVAMLCEAATTVRREVAARDATGARRSDGAE